MAETVDRSEEGKFATELPSKNLPAVEYRDLPELESTGGKRMTETTNRGAGANHSTNNPLS